MTKREKETLLNQLYHAVFDNKRRDWYGEILKATRAGDTAKAEQIGRKKLIALGRIWAVQDFLGDTAGVEMIKAANMVGEKAKRDAHERGCKEAEPKELGKFIRQLALADD